MEDLDLEPNEDLQASHHRWLLSYADLMTLLFSLFAVLFSATYAGHRNSKEIAREVRKVLGDSAAPPKAISPPVAAVAPVPELVPELAPVKAQLDDRLKQVIDSGKADVHLESRGLVIHLKDVSFFPPGDTNIRPDAYEIIDGIAQVIGPLSNLITVEGHSDDVNIHNSRFHDNWELSAARSVSMLRFLSEKYGIPQQRLSATAFADTRPLSDNASAAGRAQNRRVDIVILSEKPPTAAYR